jgi:hypothetical protein
VITWKELIGSELIILLLVLTFLCMTGLIFNFKSFYDFLKVTLIIFSGISFIFLSLTVINWCFT